MLFALTMLCGVLITVCIVLGVGWRMSHNALMEALEELPHRHALYEQTMKGPTK